jgi:hypothetical protein
MLANSLMDKMQNQSRSTSNLKSRKSIDEFDYVKYVESLSLVKIKELSIETLIKYERQTHVDNIPPDILRVIVSKLTTQNMPNLN